MRLLFKQVFNAVLIFSDLLAMKCKCLNNQLRTIRPTLINLNPDGNSQVYYSYLDR